MKNLFNNLPETVRTAAIAAQAKKPKRVNPYLYDVRKDKALRNLLRDAADHGDTVNLPVGAYQIDATEAVDNCYEATVTWVLVNAKGKTRYCYNGLETLDTTEWVKWVQKFLGVLPKPKTVKTTKKTKKIKKTRGGKTLPPLCERDSFAAIRQWEGHGTDRVMHQGGW